VTLALCMETLKKPDSPLKKVLGLAQPISSTPGIQDRAYEVGRALGADVVTVDQTALHTALAGLVESAVGVEGAAFARGQLRSYMRTPPGYEAFDLFFFLFFSNLFYMHDGRGSKTSNDVANSQKKV
jgi:NAD+ synthase (glutamine-hydrolysing)